MVTTIFLSTLSDGGHMSLGEALFVLLLSCLLLQYLMLVLGVLFEADLFSSKWHALAWFIPGWPVIEFGWKFVRNFWSL